MLLSLIADYKLPLYLISISTKIKALEIMDKTGRSATSKWGWSSAGCLKLSLGVKKHL